MSGNELNVSVKPLDEVAKSLLDRWDQFQASYANQEEAYYKLAKYAYSDWEDMRAALSSQPVTKPAMSGGEEKAIEAAVDACPLNYFQRVPHEDGLNATIHRCGISSDDFEIMLAAYRAALTTGGEEL